MKMVFIYESTSGMLSPCFPQDSQPATIRDIGLLLDYIIMMDS